MDTGERGYPCEIYIWKGRPRGYPYEIQILQGRPRDYPCEALLTKFINNENEKYSFAEPLSLPLLISDREDARLVTM